MRRGLGVGGAWLVAALSALFAACGETSLKPPDNLGGAGNSVGGSSGGSPILPPLGGQVAVDGCGSDLIPTPLTRWSMADLDNTLDQFFPAGPRLADTLPPDVGYQRDVTAA